MDELSKKLETSLKRLRLEETLVFYTKEIKNLNFNTKEINFFLHDQYVKESLDYPHETPEFNAEAALWSAEVVYKILAIFTFELENSDNLINTLPKRNFSINTSTMLSADLYLRFLPTVYKLINFHNDKNFLSAYIEDIMKDFIYSSISIEMSIDYNLINWKNILNNLCLQQLLIERIIANKSYFILDYENFTKEVPTINIDNYYKI